MNTIWLYVLVVTLCVLINLIYQRLHIGPLLKEKQQESTTTALFAGLIQYFVTCLAIYSIVILLIALHVIEFDRIAVILIQTISAFFAFGFLIKRLSNISDIQTR